MYTNPIKVPLVVMAIDTKFHKINDSYNEHSLANSVSLVAILLVDK